MWCGDWSQLPQDSLRFLVTSQNSPVLEDAKSRLYTLGTPQDGNSHLVRVACLGPYLFGSTFFSKDCEIWARSSGIYYHPSKLVDSNISAEIREAILVLDTLAYHVSFVLVICNLHEYGPATTIHMAEKHRGFLTDFDKETIYSSVRSMVESSDFFRLFRKKLTVTALREEQILGCFMIALKVSLAHCNGALDTMLTYIRRDCEQNGEGSRADELKKCGNQKYKDKAYQEACEYYTKAIAEMRYNHFLYSNRALSALQLQKYKEVELDARRVVILHPNFEKGYFKMAQVYESLKQISRAKKVLEYYTKRCNFMSLDFSREIQDLHKRLTETGEKVKNGKADTKNSQPATNKPKAKPAVPDLVSDSDSDEATPPPKQSKPPTHQTSSDTDKEMKDILKKSCDDLVVGLYKVALQGFKKVLAQKPNLTELDVVLVEYAAGCALLGMGSLEDLKNSVEYFLGIVSNHKDVVFPLAYYGVSKALIKMNRFSEALPHIEKCLSILQKGIQFSETLLWPETKTKVDNAKRPQLQKAMEEMQALCRAPPKWDAMCCYEACPLQKTIYYSDPDFKGFQQVHCASKCLVQYHPACWREYRESRNLTEKGFLGEACPTPDCCGVVVKVEAIEKDGTVGKQFVHTQLLVETAPKQKKTKKEKKLEQREQKKQQRRAAEPGVKQPTNDKDEDAALVQSIAICESTGGAVEDVPKEPSVERAKPPKTQPKAPSEQAAPPTSERVEAAPPLHRDAQYVLKKDEGIDEDMQVDGRAKKWKRKRNKPVRVLELEPSDYLYSEYQERIRRLAEYKNLVEEHGYWRTFCQRQKEMIPELDPENPFYIPEGLRHNEAALEAVLQHHGSGYADESSDVNETIYQLFEDLIESKGPISIHDKLLASEVMNFPEPAQQTVARAGGLQSFLLRSLRFTFDGDMVYTARMRPRGPSLYKPDEISLPDEGSDYEEEDECEESDEEEECDEEEANEYDSSRYIETMGQAASNPSASVASGDTTPNPSAMLMKAITCNLNPNAKAFELPLDALATGSQSGDAQPPSSSTVDKRAAAAAAAPAARTDTGREVVVQKLLVALPQKQLGECLVLAVNSFRGPLSLKTLATINNGLEHCKLCNKAVVQDFGVQVEQSIEYLEERDALVEKIKELACENARIKEQLESALDYNVQMASKNTLETSKYKEKIEDLNRELQTSRQNAKKSKLESDAEIKRLQQERVKLKEENKLLKTSRNEDNMKETLDKTITEFAKLKSKSDDLEETCRVLEEASDNALERAKRAEVRILETAHKWGLERFDRSKKHVQKVLKEMEGLKASLDPNSLAELVRKERLADLYLIEWTKEYEQFERKVQDHIGKVERGQALADLEVIDLPAKPDFEITLPKPSLLPLPRQQAPRPFAPVQDVPMAARPKVPSFPAPAPLFSHPPGIMLPPSTAAAAAPVPKAVPPMVEIPTGPRALSSAGTARPVHLGAPGAAPPPGLGPHYHAAAAPMPTANGEIAMAVSAQALTPPGYPAAASRPAEKAGNEAPGQSHRSEKLMQKLMERYPGCSREEIKAALKRVYEAKGFKGLTIADIIKDTSDVLDKTFPHARAANTQAEEEHKVPARAPQFAVPQPKPRLVLKAMRPSQSAMSQPQPPPPVPPQQKTWTSHHEPRQSWNGRATQCSICLDDLNGQTQEIRTSCGHCFHEKCLQKWFKTDHTCPNCRAHTLSDKDFPTLG
uniref:E3 ubiquitin-protein ligase TTC3 n=1 Tax=Rhipicephalus appendiculatus TaxID=34631 RepID=A0A131YZM2_RHIAP